jgi:AcrR family transcriptional regulator
MSSETPTFRRHRMTGKERREQLLDIGRRLFAERGFEGTSIEEIAAQAGVSKPVVYEHFGGKEGLYAVVVDREVERLLTMATALLKGDHTRDKFEAAAVGLLRYIDDNADGFRILVRDSNPGSSMGTYGTLLSDIAGQVEYILADFLASRGHDPKLAPMYAQMLVGMAAFTGQWWLDARKPKLEEVAANLIDLAWNGLSQVESDSGMSAAARNRLGDNYSIEYPEPGLSGGPILGADPSGALRIIGVVRPTGSSQLRGRGFSVSPDLVVTANHIVDSTDNQYVVRSPDAPEWTAARLIYGNAELDVAILDSSLEDSAAESSIDYQKAIPVLASLGIAVGEKYRTEGSANPSYAVTLLRDAAELVPSTDQNRSVILSNLAAALQDSFALTGDASALNEAIALLREAIAAAAPYQPERPAMLSNLAAALQDSFALTGDASALNEAIALLREAIAAAGPYQPERPAMLSNLAAALRARWELARDAGALSEAIALLREAVALAAADQPERPAMLSNLAAALQDSFALTGDVSALDEAISILRQVLITAPGRFDEWLRSQISNATSRREKVGGA